jgi:hypothetical protein
MAYFRWHDTDRIGNDASNNSSIVACAFVAAVKFLPSRYLATIMEYTYRQRLMGMFYEIRRWDEVMCCDIYIPSFVKIGLGIHKLIGGDS